MLNLHFLVVAQKKIGEKIKTWKSMHVRENIDMMMIQFVTQ